MRKLIFAVCSWGIGHATRSLPIIRRLLAEGFELTIISFGRALQTLKFELKTLEPNIEYYDLPDYTPPSLRTPGRLIPEMFLAGRKLFRALRREFQFVHKLIARDKYYKGIISDSRYGVYSRSLPSLFITHQLRLITPYRLKTIEFGTQIFNRFFQKRYRAFIVPDFEHEPNIAGELAHNLSSVLDKSKIHYIGPLSDFNYMDLPQSIDYLIVLSGPEPQRTEFEQKLLAQVSGLKGHVVMTACKTELGANKLLTDSQAETTTKLEIYSYLPKPKFERLLNQSKLIISRSGYSTLMDLVILRKKALLIPTPGQSEQLYLAEYHYKAGNYYSVAQNKLALQLQVAEAEKFPGLAVAQHDKVRVDRSVESAMDIIYNYLQL